jgi:hypothetical protein
MICEFDPLKVHAREALLMKRSALKESTLLYDSGRNIRAKCDTWHDLNMELSGGIS